MGSNRTIRRWAVGTFVVGTFAIAAWLYLAVGTGPERDCAKDGVNNGE